MLQTQKLAKEEFLESFKDRWPKIVQESVIFKEPALEPEAPALESPNPIVTPANDTPSDGPNPDSTSTSAHPIPFPKIM